MDDIIPELENHFTFRLVVDFRKLNKRVIPDPYPIPRGKEVNSIAKKKVYKTSLDNTIQSLWVLEFLLGSSLLQDWALLVATVLVIWKSCPIMYMGCKRCLCLHRGHPNCVFTLDQSSRKYFKPHGMLK